MYVKSRRGGGQAKRKGKSKAWRAKMRKRAEAEHARRKRAREGKTGKGLKRQIHSPEVEERYFERQIAYAERYGRWGRPLLALAWLVHNCLAHPLLGLLPCAASLWLHDRSADWLNLSPEPTRSTPPQIRSYGAWLVHNCLAHPAMGLAPLSAAFAAHERSAAQMAVPDWV